MTLPAPVARTASTRDWNPATSYAIPAHVPPSRQHVHPEVSPPVARSGYGSLNRSSTTASSPLKALATPVQKDGAYSASGIGFWQVAWTSAQPEDGPVYAPWFQCISTIGVMPWASSRETNPLTSLWYAAPP